LVESVRLFFRIMKKAMQKKIIPVTRDRMDGSISKEGAMLLPIKAPVIRRITGNTYKRKVTTSKGFVSSPITTWSPLLTFRVFLTAIIISFLPLWEVPQLSLEEQDSQVPDRIVLIQARDGFTSVTIPFSVIMN